MLNFRKLKHDFSPAVLKEGKTLFEQDMVASTKIMNFKQDAIRFSCRVKGNFENCYQSELEIDRQESMIIDSDCDCSYKYDCQHLAAVLFHLEANYNQILVDYSKETNLEEKSSIDASEIESLRMTFKEAETKEHLKKGEKFEKELLQEYIYASKVLGRSAFFSSEEETIQDKAELAVIFSQPSALHNENYPIEIQLALRLPCRSKPLTISQIKPFLDAVRYHESIYIGNKKYFFTLQSFDEASAEILRLIIDFSHVFEVKGEKNQRAAFMDLDSFGSLLAISYDIAEEKLRSKVNFRSEENSDLIALPCIYSSVIEEPLKVALNPAEIRFQMDYLEIPSPKVLLKPDLILQNELAVSFMEVTLFECAKPGLIHHHIYYRFPENIKRKHLRSLSLIQNMTIPEPLFGTFVENALFDLMRFAKVENRLALEHFVTLPFTEQLKADCHINYLNGELEASLSFLYGNLKIPATTAQLTVDHVRAFVTEEGILARNLTEEQKILDHLFQDFVHDPISGIYSAKNEKKIVEFMTETIPVHQNQVNFHCPENLLDQFIYDDSTFTLNLKETDRVDMYQVEIKVDGYLSDTTVDLLWDCVVSKRAFVELSTKKGGKRKSKVDPAAPHKILVLDLEKIAPIIQILDELGINRLDAHQELRPLWSLANLNEEQFTNLPVRFSISPKLKEIQDQMIGKVPFPVSAMPSTIKASFRNYQLEGVHWLDRLRSMHLNGILADDMGLGKTLQAITVLTRYQSDYPSHLSLVVCPTSLVYNWKEEIAKFNPLLKVLAVDGNPAHRKKILAEAHHHHIIVTSYTLLQKDIEIYSQIPLGYVILDEAQHIKNRGTRNAQSVKKVQAAHRLILTGTPIENSLDELWSLFDFLMPGLLSSYDRFVEKYLKSSPSSSMGKNLDLLKQKVSPFILRRMKKDVLEDLPPISHITYHCHLSEIQQELYRSYAASAREELSQLVKKEGFDRVQIHVLATLTRLKQICCHPAIFAKDRAESGDSAKYEMLMELLQTLRQGRHKTVIFSQYTRMLNIIREDLQKQGIRFEYLDGSSKNRLSIVKKFNEDATIPIFLVSLKAGGSGLNLVGADIVIHYDSWWNPAVENQATDRVHRIGQKNKVISYKLITQKTIEEKILELHNRKQGLVKDVVSGDEDVISKLTWEEVLELLQT